jgi:hypothetical protein
MRGNPALPGQECRYGAVVLAGTLANEAGFGIEFALQRPDVLVSNEC